MNMFSQYLLRVKKNIHCVIAMSPLNKIFVTRLRKFPSLVNCCTIDWFTNWPAEALINVGKGSFADSDMNLGEHEDNCVEVFREIHQTVEKMTDRFLDELRRQNYVTPTSYLEQLATFKKVLTFKRREVGDAKMRLEKGLNVLYEAAIEVANLQEALEKKQPELEKTVKEVSETKIVIAKETEDANKVKVVVAAEEQEASVQEAEVNKIKTDADKDLAVALPALENAVKKVKEIKVNDFYELKGISKPSPSIVECFKICCMLMQSGRPPKPNAQQKESDPEGYFLLAKSQLLSKPQQFLDNMIKYDKDNIADQLIDKVRPLLELEAMKAEKVAGASQALVAVRIWILAMITYHDVLKIVNPKRAIAKEMGGKLEVVQKALNEKRAQVKEINDRLDALTTNMNNLIQQQKDLDDDIADCNKKLERAEKMISGLEGEKVRWTDTVKELG
jgi:dynein heavy chain